LTRAIKTLEEKQIYKGCALGPLELNPNSHYYQDSWKDENAVVRGNLIAVICKKDLLEATTLGLELLKQVYNWNDNQPLDFQIGTFNDSWWHKL
jgi:hypothetical protein